MAIDQNSLLFVGLGNPGRQYERTRHNVGWLFLDYFQSRNTASMILRDKFYGHFGVSGDGKFMILKPTTFMNLSGKSVAECAQFYKISPNRIYVFHDELDLELGAVKIQSGGGAAGHNGLKSIEACIGSKETMRVRIGISHPRNTGNPRSVADYVLEDFHPNEFKALEDTVFPKIESALMWVLKGDLLRAMTEANKKLDKKS